MAKKSKARKVAGPTGGAPGVEPAAPREPARAQGDRASEPPASSVAAQAAAAKPHAGARALRVVAAVGVLSAAVLAVGVNVLVSRFYTRWDWTSTGLYTLSPATVETLESLTEPIDVVVFLSASDPLSASVRHMLSAYGAKTVHLRQRWVDPDRSSAEFLALQQKYGLLAGKTEDGRIVTDASIVLARGERRWFVSTSDMVAVDEEDNRSRPKLEQALTEGLRSVLEKESARICFTAGHQEASIDDGSAQGAAELRYRLEKNNYEVAAADLAGSEPEPLKGCHVVIVAGPQQEVPQRVATLIGDYLNGGGNLLLLLNPGLSEDERIRPTGLESVARAAGIELGVDFVVEKSAPLRLPSGLGETFFATPKSHAITRGMLARDGSASLRVLVSATQSLRGAPGSAAESLLVTSAEAFSVKDVRPFVEAGSAPERGPNDPAGPFSVAMAAELPKRPGSTAAHGPRCVVVGTANPLFSRNWREPSLAAAQVFIESALSWLAARPAIVSVPEKPQQQLGLALTEESITDVRNYVLVYMPLAAALLGTFVVLRRRRAEKRARAGAGSGAGES
ncbi:MAG: GldG family protein [Polyangiaceae bacterium]|nr:GldG family protein [Polyangiaceae bacterium]